MKFSLLVIVAIAVSLIACGDAERAKADNKQFAELGVSKSLWLEIDPPPNMPDGTRCYVWYARNGTGKSIGQVPMCNTP